MPLVTSTSVQGNLYRQSTSPTTAVNGDVWVDTDTGAISSYNGSSWVLQTAGALGAARQLLKMNSGATAIEYAEPVTGNSGAPAAAENFSDRQTLYDSTNNKLYYVSKASNTACFLNLTDGSRTTNTDFTTNPVINYGFTAFTDEALADMFFAPTDTAKCGVNITNDVLDFDIDTDSTNIGWGYDLGEAVSDSAWVLRMAVSFSALTQEAAARLYVGLSDETQTSGGDNAQDFLGILIRNISGTTNYGSLDTDGAAPDATVVDNASTSVTWATSTTYYIEIIRTAATTYTVGVYSDSGYTTVLGGGPIAGTVAATTASLRYIRMFNQNAAANGVFTGTVIAVSFYNGVTSV